MGAADGRILPLSKSSCSRTRILRRSARSRWEAVAVRESAPPLRSEEQNAIVKLIVSLSTCRNLEWFCSQPLEGSRGQGVRAAAPPPDMGCEREKVEYLRVPPHGREPSTHGRRSCVDGGLDQQQDLLA